MPAYMNSFPGCCTARVITGLYGDLGDTPESLARSIEICATNAKEEGAKLLTAITTQNQTVGIQALKLCGFKNDPEVENHRNVAHADTRVTLWSKELSD